MELYSEIARLALTDDEKTRLRVRFTENPNIESKAQAVLPTCGNDNLK
ncbi:8532_t:CDS:1, partial [Paraglomus brasilianum]